MTGEPEIYVSRARARERPNKTTCHICHSAPSDELKLRFRIAWSGASPQVGHTRMAFTVRAAVRGLAAIPERRKIARIAARPTAGTRRQVNDGYASVDQLLIDKIFSKRYLALHRFGDRDVHHGIIDCRHCSLALEFVESTRPQTRCAMPLKWPQNADFVWDAGGRVLSPYANPLLFQAMRRPLGRRRREMPVARCLWRRRTLWRIRRRW